MAAISALLILGALAAAGYAGFRKIQALRGRPARSGPPGARPVLIAAVVAFVAGTAIAPAQKDEDVPSTRQASDGGATTIAKQPSPERAAPTRTKPSKGPSAATVTGKVTTVPPTSVPASGTQAPASDAVPSPPAEPVVSDAAMNLYAIDGEIDAVSYDRKLRRLRRLCTGATLTRLSDFTVNASQMLERETGDAVSLPIVIAGVTSAAQGNPGGQKCIELFTAYYALVVGGSPP